MPFREINVEKIIEEEKSKDPEFAIEWERSRSEYKLISEFIQIRNQNNITQKELSEKLGKKQQTISRIEKRESSPTLRTFCRLLDIMGYELNIVKK